MAFDPTNPLGEGHTLARIRATGAGQACVRRLTGVAAASIAAAIAAFWLSTWWLACWPFALACLCGYGLAAKATDDLDLRRAPAAPLRGLLAIARVAFSTAGYLSVAVGVVLVVGTTLEWGWLLDVIE